MEVNVQQLFDSLVGLLLIIGWMGIALAVSGLAILIFRLIKIARN